MATFDFRDGHLTCDDGRLRIVFDASTGGIRSVVNLLTEQVLVEADAPVPWRMQAPDTNTRLLAIARQPSYKFDTIEPGDFSAEVGDDSASLSWTTTREGISVHVDVAFGEHGVELTPRVDVRDDLLPPADLTYPILTSPKQLSQYGSNDCLSYPLHSGWLIRRPMQGWPISFPYPEGNFGCSVQFLSYFEQAKGGFYLATHDPHVTWKTFTFSGAEIVFTYENWDNNRGQSMDCDFPVVIAPLERGDWFEGTEIYRSWAQTAPWWPSAPKRETEQARWLRDEIWVSLWCTPSIPDWSVFYDFYAKEFESPLHLVPGFEWPAKRPNTVGYEGWFPAQFHENNLKSWAGHYVTPYLNDWFVSQEAEDFFEKWEPEVVRPYAQFDMTLFSHPSGRRMNGEPPVGDPRIMSDRPFYLCPHGELQKELRNWRDLRLMAEYDCAGSFYDISSGCPYGVSQCINPAHDHPPGRGRHMMQQLEVSNRAAKDHVRKESGKYLVQGTEVIIENIIPSVDFYVSRAVAGPMGFLEAWVGGPHEPPGTGRELIPLFQSVYHDVGPVCEDGWIRLIEEEGELFFWVAARLYLEWGGLMSVHYPLDPAERPPGYDGGSWVIAWGGERLDFEAPLPELDPGKTGYIKELGRARTTFANAYLGYGRMLRPISVDCGTVDLHFLQKLPLVDTFRNEDTWTVPQVHHGSWTCDATGNVGILLTNLHATDPTTVALDIDLQRLWGLDRAGHEVVRIDANGSSSLGSVDEQNRIATKIELAPRRVVLVEIR